VCLFDLQKHGACIVRSTTVLKFDIADADMDGLLAQLFGDPKIRKVGGAALVSLDSSKCVLQGTRSLTT
jgi:hypothetical protein